MVLHNKKTRVSREMKLLKKRDCYLYLQSKVMRTMMMNCFLFNTADSSIDTKHSS